MTFREMFANPITSQYLRQTFVVAVIMVFVVVAVFAIVDVVVDVFILQNIFLYIQFYELYRNSVI
jgi:hypothetical protein